MSTDTQQDAREQARQKADVMIECIQAHRDGKQIQYLNVSWFDYHGPVEGMRFDLYPHRVKPEERKPREWVIRPHGMGAGIVVESGPAIGESVLVREVLPETEKEP